MLKYLSSVALLVFLVGCSARDYHVTIAQEAQLNTTQMKHIQAAQYYAEQERRARSGACRSYPLGLGSFSAGCTPDNS